MLNLHCSLPSSKKACNLRSIQGSVLLVLMLLTVSAAICGIQCAAHLPASHADVNWDSHLALCESCLPTHHLSIPA